MMLCEGSCRSSLHWPFFVGHCCETLTMLLTCIWIFLITCMFRTVGCSLHSISEIKNAMHSSFVLSVLCLGTGVTLEMLLWEPPTVQNRQLTQCSKSRRYLYTTAFSLAVCTPTQALPNQHSPQKLQRPLVSVLPRGKSIKMQPPTS
jgi:hypothetical protein